MVRDSFSECFLFEYGLPDDSDLISGSNVKTLKMKKIFAKKLLLSTASLKSPCCKGRPIIFDNCIYPVTQSNW